MLNITLKASEMIGNFLKERGEEQSYIRVFLSQGG